MDESLNRALVFGSQAVAVLLVLLGSFLQKANFRSARPPGPATQLEDYSEEGNRYARLWDDPLSDYAVFTEDDEKPAGDVKRTRLEVAEPQGLGRKREQRDQAEVVIPKVPEPRSDQLVLWNVVDARPGPVARERRLRTRYALISSLAAAGYLPRLDSALIEFRLPKTWYLDWTQRLLQEPAGDAAAEANPELVGLGYYETFRRSDTGGGAMPEYVLVVWHPRQSRMTGSLPESQDLRICSPVDTVEEVHQALLRQQGRRCGLSANARLVVLNHGSSNQLSRHLDWLGDFGLAEAAAGSPGGHEVVFTSATAPPTYLLRQRKQERLRQAKQLIRETASPWRAPRRMLAATLRSGGKLGELSERQRREDELLFAAAARLRAVPPDDLLAGGLVEEIFRRVPLLHAREGGRVVIFTESDGVYGRTLADLMEEKIRLRQMQLGLHRENIEVEVFTYLKGLDGLESERRGGEASKKTGTGGAEVLDPYHSGISEKTWGTSQFDYLRRLAGQLGDPGKDKRIVAVGVLGSDVYDKLLVLQAVRPNLPDALYFTTDLDSIYTEQEQLPFTRNLLIASGAPLETEGMEVDGELEWTLPPMRDSYQVALVRRLRSTLNARPYETATQPELREVGAGTLHPLKPLAEEEKSGPDRLMALAGAPLTNLGIFLGGLLNSLLLLGAIRCICRDKDEREMLEETGRVTRDESRGGRAAAALVFVEGMLAALGMGCLTAALCASTLPRQTPVIAGLWALSGFLFWCWTKRHRFRSTPYFWLTLVSYALWLPGVLLMPAGPVRLRLVMIALATGLLVLISWWRSRRAETALPERGDTRRRSWAIYAGFGACGWMALVTAISGERDPHLFHEPVELVAGVGLWPSVMLRLLAFVVGLLLLYRTSRIFAKRGESLRQEVVDVARKLKSADKGRASCRWLHGWDRLSAHLGWGLHLMRPFGGLQEISRHAQEMTRPLGGELADFFGSCFDPQKRFLRVVSVTILYLLVSMVLFTMWPPMVPARGGLVFLIEKLSLCMGVGLYIVHLCFCVELHLTAYALIRRLTQLVDRSQPDQLSRKVDCLQSMSRVIAEITGLVGVTLLYPATILSLLLFSRLRIFDNWTMTPSLLLTLVLGATVLGTVSVMIVSASHRFRRSVKDAVDRLIHERADEQAGKDREVAREKAMSDAEKQLVDLQAARKALEAERDRLEARRDGAFAPWYQQPIFIVILGAAGLIGGLGLLDPVLSMFFG